MNKRFIIAAFVIAVGLPGVPAARLIAPASNREIQTQSEAIESLLRSQQYAKALEAATKLTQAHPDNPLGYNFQGAIYLASQDIAKARASFEKAVSVQSDYEPALMNLAELDLQQKNLSAARTRYQAVLTRNANNVFAMLGMAKVEAGSKNDAETLAWLRRAKAARPEVAGPRLGLANYYLSKKDYDQTSAELAEWGRLQPNNPEMLIVLGRLQTATGKNAEAVSTYQKLVSVRPQSHVAYQTLAVAQMQAGDISGATASFKKALALKPDFVDALSGLALLEFQANRHAEALKLAKKIQTVAPKDAIGFVLEGDALVEDKRYPGALAAYEKAFALSPTGSTAIKVHSAQARAGNTLEADARLQKWSGEHPDDMVVPLYRAQEFQKSGKNNEAIEQYQVVLRKDPTNLMALNNLANLYQAAKDPRAVATAEEAFKLNPNSPAIADTLGWMLVESGQTERGVSLLKKAVAHAPKNAEIRYHFAAALAKSGDKMQARKEIETLLATTQQFPQRKAAETLLKQL